MKNELFYSLNDYFDVELNENFPEVYSVNGYVSMPEGDLKFKSIVSDKGCFFHENEIGTVTASLFSDGEIYLFQLCSEGNDYVNDVNRIVSEWFSVSGSSHANRLIGEIK